MGEAYIFRFDVNDPRDGCFIRKENLGVFTGVKTEWNDGKVGLALENEMGQRTWKTFMEDGTARYLKHPFKVRSRPSTPTIKDTPELRQDWETVRKRCQWAQTGTWNNPHTQRARRLVLGWDTEA